MSNNLEKPDFSLIRSVSERHDAERSYEIGCDIADAVLDARDLVSRAVERVSRTLARKPIASI